MTEAPWEAVAATLSPRLTGIRVRALGVNPRAPIDEPTARLLWAAGLLLDCLPDHPEGAVAAAVWAAPTLASVRNDRVSTLGIMDGWAVGVTGRRGLFNLAEGVADPTAVLLPCDWTWARYYSLPGIFSQKGRELKEFLRCVTPPPPGSGPTPPSSPPPSSSS